MGRAKEYRQRLKYQVASARKKTMESMLAVRFAEELGMSETEARLLGYRTGRWILNSATCWASTPRPSPAWCDQTRLWRCPYEERSAISGAGSPTAGRIIQLYLEMHTETEIVARTGHSYEAIENYIKEFAAVLVLSERGLTAPLIRRVTGRSIKLIYTYLDLIDEYSGAKYAFRFHHLRRVFQMHEDDFKKTCGVSSDEPPRTLPAAGGKNTGQLPGAAPGPQVRLRQGVPGRPAAGGRDRPPHGGDGGDPRHRASEALRTVCRKRTEPGPAAAVPPRVPGADPRRRRLRHVQETDHETLPPKLPPGIFQGQPERSLAHHRPLVAGAQEGSFQVRRPSVPGNAALQQERCGILGPHDRTDPTRLAR